MNITKLLKFRKQIDKLDNQIIKLLKKRSMIIPKVRKIKEQSPWKVAFKREFDMAHMLSKKDFGLYDNNFMQKIWREIISATLKIECNLQVGIYNNEKDVMVSRDLWEMAKDHFGTANSIIKETSLKNIFNKLLEKELEVAILPMPQYFVNNAKQNTNEDKWWLYLKEEKYQTIKINVSLPFIKEFKTFAGNKGLCISLNNKDVMKDELYYILKPLNDTKVENFNNEEKLLKEINILDSYNGYFFIKTAFSEVELFSFFNKDEWALYFVGSSRKPL